MTGFITNYHETGEVLVSGKFFEGNCSPWTGRQSAKFRAMVPIPFNAVHLLHTNEWEFCSGTKDTLSDAGSRGGTVETAELSANRSRPISLNGRGDLNDDKEYDIFLRAEQNRVTFHKASNVHHDVHTMAMGYPPFDHNGRLQKRFFVHDYFRPSTIFHLLVCSACGEVLRVSPQEHVGVRSYPEEMFLHLDHCNPRWRWHQEQSTLDVQIPRRPISREHETVKEWISETLQKFVLDDSQMRVSQRCSRSSLASTWWKARWKAARKWKSPPMDSHWRTDSGDWSKVENIKTRVSGWQSTTLEYRALVYKYAILYLENPFLNLLQIAELGYRKIRHLPRSC